MIKRAQAYAKRLETCNQVIKDQLCSMQESRAELQLVDKKLAQEVAQAWIDAGWTVTITEKPAYTRLDIV